MKKTSIRSLIAAAIAFVMVLSFAPAAVFAHDGEDTNDDSTSQAEDTQDQSGSDSTSAQNEVENESSTEATQTSSQTLHLKLQDLMHERQGIRNARLETAKLKVCEARQAKVTSIMNRSITRAERQLALFTKISDRVKAFYVNKGYSLDTYAQLVTAVDAAKAVATTDLQTLKGLDGFDCNSDDPKGDVAGFKLALDTVRGDLKDYRTAVKNLIVGVKSVVGTDAKKEGEGEQ